MSRISIEIPAEEHKRLKALAALEGQSIEELVLQRTLAAARGSDEEQAVLAVEATLNERIRKAEAGEVSDQTVSDIFEEVYRESGKLELKGWAGKTREPSKRIRTAWDDRTENQ